MTRVTKEALFDGLYKILTSKIAPNRFYGARCRGFRSEIAFAILARKRGWNLLDGGQCLFTSANWPIKKENSIVYVTVSSDSPKRYIDFYSLLSKLSIFLDGFFVSFKKPDKWSYKEIEIKNRKNKRIQTNIPKPKFNILKFSNGKFRKSKISKITDLFPTKEIRVCAKKGKNDLRYITRYGLKNLALIYSNRFFLDIELGGFKKSMIDFDGIIQDGSNFTAVETKEKDALKETSNKNDWYFGWDSRRLGWYLYLKEQIGLDSLYVIREVANQTSRNFVAWKGISLKEFCECASWLSEHGGGGGSGTITAPYLKFRKL